MFAPTALNAKFLNKMAWRMSRTSTLLETAAVIWTMIWVHQTILWAATTKRKMKTTKMRTRTKRSPINSNYSRKKIRSLRLIIKPQLWLKKKPISRTIQLKSSQALWACWFSKNKRKCKKCSWKINPRNTTCHSLKLYQSKISPNYQSLNKESISAESGHTKRVLSRGISLLGRLLASGSTNSSAFKKN